MVVSALVMGVAVCGMHYTGMMAADFANNPNLSPIQPTNMNYFIMIIFGIDAIILMVSLMVSMSHNRTLH